MSKCKEFPGELEDYMEIVKVRVWDNGEYFDTEDVNKLIKTST